MELWFLQAEELVHSLGSVLQRSSPWVWKGRRGKVLALCSAAGELVWVSSGCSGC